MSAWRLILNKYLNNLKTKFPWNFPVKPSQLFENFENEKKTEKFHKLNIKT